MEMARRFCDTGAMSQANQIARVKIQLDDWQPAIWRRVEVPLTTTLKALHDLIQAVMPFEDCHLFEFRADGKRYAIPDREWDSLHHRTFSAKNMRLGTLVDRGVSELAYTYDFGDDWRHTVTIEATASADPGTDYPRFVDGAGRAPPEDVGGIPGFELFLDAMADPRHEQHDALMRWYGRSFEVDDIDEEEIRIRVEALARRRAVGKAGFEKSRANQG